MASAYDVDAEEEVTVPIGSKKPRRPPNANRLGGFAPTGGGGAKTAGTAPLRNALASSHASAEAATGDLVPTSVSSSLPPPSAGSLPGPSPSSFSARSVAVVSTTAASSSARRGDLNNPHSLPMKYAIGDLANLRPNLRDSGRYRPTDSIAALIPSGDRTATTRRPPPGVAVGDYIVFPATEGVYRVEAFVRVDLSTAAGVEAWSVREGWSVEAAVGGLFGSQVATGRTQMIFQRVDTV